jgi:transcriptional regulator with XRE-family HTH domain
MANIGALLKDEISRLSRREIRRQTGALRKASTTYRRNIAALKRQIGKLERQVKLVGSRATRAPAAAAESASGEQSPRFVAKGLRTLRSRLGLSAAQLGTLVGVTGQSIYNWEAKKATPRREQLLQLAALRGIGKKEAAARLAQVAPAAGKKPRKAKAKVGKVAKVAKPKAKAKTKAKAKAKSPRKVAKPANG